VVLRHSGCATDCQLLRCLGKCSNDGFYFNDDTSITMCSNGNSYLMHCAPGTMNQGGRKYSKSYSDFCDINLNDYGYGASKPGSQKAFSSSHSHGSSGYQMPDKKPSYQPAPSYPMPPAKPTYMPPMAPSYMPPKKAMPPMQPSYVPPKKPMPPMQPSYMPPKKPSYAQPLKPRQHYPVAYVPVYMDKH